MGCAAMIRAVAAHISNRTLSEVSFTDIDAVRLKARSNAVTPTAPASASNLGLPVPTCPRVPTVASSTPQASQRWARPQLENAQCWRYTAASKGSTRSSNHSAAKAPRVPVINSATMLKPSVKASAAIRDLPLACASNSAEKGSVHTTNSAKKLRLTKVDAGFGPCGKKLKSNQNCKAAQRDATTAPQ